MPQQDMKTTIAKAFKKLLQKKSLDKVTVKDIVEECHITRQTFYYHFQDLMDLMEWMVSQGVDDALRSSLQIDDKEKALRIFLAPIMENREMAERLLHSQKREQVEKILVQGIQSYLNGLIEAKGLFTNTSRTELDIALKFYSYGMAGLMMELSQKTQIDIPTAARQILKLLEKTLIHLDESV